LGIFGLNNYIAIAGVYGDGYRAGEIWEAFEKLNEEKPVTGKLCDDCYEIRLYDGENSAIAEWPATNKQGYAQRLPDGVHYCIEHYDERFRGLRKALQWRFGCL
jgi:phage-related protein